MGLFGSKKKETIVVNPMDLLAGELASLAVRSDDVLATFRAKVIEIDEINGEIAQKLDAIATKKAELDSLTEKFSTMKDANLKVRAKFEDFLV